MEQLIEELTDLLEIATEDCNATFSCHLINPYEIIFELNGSNYQFCTTPCDVNIVINAL